MRRPSPFALVLGAAATATALPLWSGHYLPLVDLPQHLHLINVLGHLDDPATLYPEIFKTRGQLTPYLGYYYAVWLLAKVFGLFAANQIFLTAVAVLTPVAMASLLRSLGRNPWLALFACPLFYGDNFYWGFINYCAALPLLFFAMALFVDTLTLAPDPKYRREVGLGLLMVSVQLMHIQAFMFAALALPLLLVMTPSDPARRIRAASAALPGVLFFGIYSIGRLGDKPDVAPGAPWHAWGPILSKQNLSFSPPGANWDKLPELLANGFQDKSDRPVVTWLVAALVLTVVASMIAKPTEKPGSTWPARLRGAALAALALAMFLYLPFDIRGYIYYLNWRFGELFALLVITALPFPGTKGLRTAVIGAGLAIAVVYGVTLASHFRDFDREANAIDTIAKAIPKKAKIAAMSFDTASAIASHPVYLHIASYAALASGGITSFSFASTPHSPLAYQGEPPPAPASEWRPDLFDFRSYGAYYDYFLVRGRVPARSVFRELVGEFAIAAQSGELTLYRHVTTP